MKLEEYLNPILDRMTSEQRAMMRAKVSELKKTKKSISFQELNEMIRSVKSTSSSNIARSA